MLGNFNIHHSFGRHKIHYNFSFLTSLQQDVWKEAFHRGKLLGSCLEEEATGEMEAEVLHSREEGFRSQPFLSESETHFLMTTVSDGHWHMLSLVTLASVSVWDLCGSLQVGGSIKWHCFCSITKLSWVVVIKAHVMRLVSICCH